MSLPGWKAHIPTPWPEWPPLSTLLLPSLELTFSSHTLVCATLDRLHDACPLGVAVQLAPPCVAILLVPSHDPHSPHSRPHCSLTFRDPPQQGTSRCTHRPPRDLRGIAGLKPSPCR